MTENKKKFQPLINKFFGNSVLIEEIITMEKGASSRYYFRLKLKNSQVSSCVLMQMPQDTSISDEVTNKDETITELPFINVQKQLESKNLRVPHIYCFDEELNCILIEDLGNSTLNSHLQGLSPTQVLAWYVAAVELLALMHQKMWPVPQGCIALRRNFSYDLLLWELNHYLKWRLEASLKINLDKKTKERLGTVFSCLAKEIENLPKGFVHRDYQSRNLMVQGNEAIPDNLATIDFQDALTGPRIYDLVALLNDSYVDLSPEDKDYLVAHYAKIRNIPLKEITKEFLLVTIQRKLKDAGRFVFIDQVKGDPSFLPFIDKSIQRVADALKKLDNHDDLKKILSQIDPCL